MSVVQNHKPIEKAFNLWISQYPESFHPCDMERFYILVKTVCRYGRGGTNDTEWLRRKIVKSGKYLSEENILHYCELYRELQEFHKVGAVKNYEIQDD